MEAIPERPSVKLRRLVNGFQASQAIHVAARLGLADVLADDSRGSDDLAAATATHPDALYRLLRALAALGVLREGPDRQFSLTEVGACLRSDAPEPIGGWAAFVGDPVNWQAWTGLEHAVRTGENAFRHVHGADPWTLRAGDPARSVVFDRAMADNSRQVAASVLAAFDFGRFGTVADVAGGSGAFLAAMLTRWPALHGILFDQPHVVAGAPPVLAAAGVSDRCQVVGGSFFDAVPAGANAYVLKSILHDWEDGDCIRILRTCRRAMPDGAALLVIEQELGPANANPAAKLSDLNMMVVPGGRERSDSEYAALFTAAGFQLVGVAPSDIGFAVFEGAPA